MIPIGVLGGSFDPVHRGHILLASRAKAALGVSSVLLVPCAEPPHKPDRLLAARYHRLEMLYLALQDRPGLGVSTIEIAKGGVQYTIDTLRAFRRASPPLAPIFLCGSDALADIELWRDYEALLAEFDFAVVTRARVDAPWPPIIRRRIQPIPAPGGAHLGEGGNLYAIPMPELDVSSSDVRDRCRRESAVDHLVPASVARYIQRHRLYAEEVLS